MLKTTIFKGLLPSVQTVVKLSVVALSTSLFISGCTNETKNSGANTSPTTESSADNKASNTAGTLRIGFQKSATVLFSLKGKGTLEKVFKEKGVTWSEFPAGLPMVEALNAGAIDVAYVGEAPPVFAQAAKGSTVRYIAYDPYGVEAEGIVVHKDSPIRSIADLKGKKLAVQKGANAHYLAVKAIESVGLKITDVQFSFVKPSDARAAFEKKNVDAWSVWDPYLAAIETEGARLITNAKGLAPNRGYYLSSQEFIDKNTLMKIQLLKLSASFGQMNVPAENVFISMNLLRLLWSTCCL